MSNANTLSALDRITALTDENSFVEIGAQVTARSTDFNLQEKKAPSDGVITGYGLVSGVPVYVYSQDASVLNGTVGEMHAKKIARLYTMAAKMGVPIVGLMDSAGMRLQESTDALAGFGEIYAAAVRCSGIVPQICAVFGDCGGGAALLAAMSDFTFMEKNARLFVNSPNTLDGNTAEKCDTASAAFQQTTQNVDFVVEGEESLLSKMRELVSVLPENNQSVACTDESMDDLNRMVPDFAAEISDPALALEDLGDNNFFLECKAGCAKEMVTGFLCLDGMTVGAVANRTATFDDKGQEKEKFEARLTTQGCQKAASFIKKCDAFGIPILTLTNVEGYATSVAEEKTIAKAAAELTAEFAQASVPKVNCIVGKAYGSAYITMNSKHIGADLVFALPDAHIGMMDADVAAKIMYADDSAEMVKNQAAKFAETSGTDAALSRGIVDAVIEPESVRKQLLYAFEMLFSKTEEPIDKKHGTI